MSNNHTVGRDRLRAARMESKRLSHSLAGQKLAKTIYGGDGRPLLRRGTVLTGRYISALLERGFDRVYIQDPRFPDLDLSDPITSETRHQAMSAVQKVFAQVRSGGPLPATEVTSVVNLLLEEVLELPESGNHLLTIRNWDDYTFVHSVNVAVLSLLVGKAMGLQERDLFDLGVGALLHDVGKADVPLEILNKPGRLTDEEMAVMQTHSEQGWNRLKDSDPISFVSAHVAFDHHERLDGQGYPRRLKGDEILFPVRIAATTDVYDALLADRVYRPAYTPREIFVHLEEETEGQFDRAVVRAMRRSLALFPNGTVIRLSNGEVGIVLAQDPEAPDRPVIGLVQEAGGKPIQPSKHVRLASIPDVEIVEELKEYPA